MNKQEEKLSQEKLAAMSQIDPFTHGYAKEDSVAVPAPLYMAMMQFAGATAQKERTEYFEIATFKIGDANAIENNPRVGRVMTTKEGMEAEAIFDGLLDVHYGNIEAGKTITEGDTPKLDMGDAPKG